MKVKVGIIACGSITEFRHAPEYAENPHSEIVAYYNPTKSRAEKMAALYGGKAVDDYTEIIENPEIDAISVCSPNNTHHIYTIEALKNNKHVLCEKPMATTIEYAKEMLETSKHVGKKLMMGHNQRLADAVSELRRSLRRRWLSARQGHHHRTLVHEE